MNDTSDKELKIGDEVLWRSKDCKEGAFNEARIVEFQGELVQFAYWVGGFAKKVWCKRTELEIYLRS